LNIYCESNSIKFVCVCSVVGVWDWSILWTFTDCISWISHQYSYRECFAGKKNWRYSAFSFCVIISEAKFRYHMENRIYETTSISHISIEGFDAGWKTDVTASCNCCGEWNYIWIVKRWFYLLMFFMHSITLH